MIYKFTIISDEVENFMREIQIDSHATFLDLHKLILDSCKYKDDQLTSFTICENGWEKGQEITLEEMDTSMDKDCYIMAKTELSEFLEDEKQHLLYTFDMLAERVFFIELSSVKPGSMKEGKITRSMGDAPQQTLDFDELLSRNPIVSDTTVMDEENDMFGDEVDMEDISLEGLDISDGEY